MTEYEQDLYDVIADWWDIIFDINPAPVDRNGEYIDKHATIIDLVEGIKLVLTHGICEDDHDSN